MSEMVLIRSDDGALERLKVGDANSAICYRIVCSCKANLGPLASFVERSMNASPVVVEHDDGTTHETAPVPGPKLRLVRCMRCDLVTVVQGASIIAVVPLDALPDGMRPAGLLVVPERPTLGDRAAFADQVAKGIHGS